MHHANHERVIHARGDLEEHVAPTERDSGLKDGIYSDAVGRGFPDLFYELRKALSDAVSIDKMLPE